MTAREHQIPVHRSLMQRDLIIGIPQAGLVIIMLLGTFFILVLEMYLAVIPLALLFVIMKIMTKRDPYLIDILIEHLHQKDVLVP